MNIVALFVIVMPSASHDVLWQEYIGGVMMSSAPLDAPMARVYWLCSDA